MLISESLENLQKSIVYKVKKLTKKSDEKVGVSYSILLSACSSFSPLAFMDDIFCSLFSTFGKF
jgi:hypothetical protein